MCFTILKNWPYNLAHACLRSHQNVMSRTPIINIRCCLSDIIQCSTFISRHSTCKVDIFICSYFIVTTNDNCTYDISQLLVGPSVCQLDFSHVALCVFENAPDSFSSYVVGYYHINWKTSLKSYKKVPRQNQQTPLTKEGASIKHQRV